MNQDASPGVQAFLYEGIARREVFEYILVLDIIHLNHTMFETGKQIIVERQPQSGHYMRDIGLLHGFFPP